MKAKKLAVFWKGGRPFFPSGYYLVAHHPPYTTVQTVVHVYVRNNTCYYKYMNSEDRKTYKKKMVARPKPKVRFRGITSIKRSQYNMLINLWRN